MTRLLFLLLLFLYGCGSYGGGTKEEEKPKNKVGFSALAIQNESYPVEFLEVFRDVETRYLAILWESFGSDNSKLKAVLDLPGKTHLNIYLGNGSCRRNGNCSERDSGNPLAVALRRFEDSERFLQSFKWAGTIRYTITLEDNLTGEQAETICEAIKRARVYEVYRNPVYAELITDSSCFDGYELHEDALRRAGNNLYFSSYSNDGFDLQGDGFFSWNVPRRISRADVLTRIGNGDGNQTFYVWSARGSNCLRAEPIQSVYPFRRRCDIDPELFTRINLLILEAIEWH